MGLCSLSAPTSVSSNPHRSTPAIPCRGKHRTCVHTNQSHGPPGRQQRAQPALGRRHLVFCRSCNAFYCLGPDKSSPRFWPLQNLTGRILTHLECPRIESTRKVGSTVESGRTKGYSEVIRLEFKQRARRFKNFDCPCPVLISFRPELHDMAQHGADHKSRNCDGADRHEIDSSEPNHLSRTRIHHSQPFSGVLPRNTL